MAIAHVFGTPSDCAHVHSQVKNAVPRSFEHSEVEYYQMPIQICGDNIFAAHLIFFQK